MDHIVSVFNNLTRIITSHDNNGRVEIEILPLSAWWKAIECKLHIVTYAYFELLNVRQLCESSVLTSTGK